MRNNVKLGKSIVGEYSPPYIIAEIGVNHEGSLDRAKKLIDLCKEGGADAAKFQTYKAETLASKHSPAYWNLEKENTESQYELFKKYDAFGENEYHTLSNYCESVGIDFVSTPFDTKSVDFLDRMMPFFKVASADITNLPLLRKIGSKDKPILLSTGASDVSEIQNAIEILQSAGAAEIILLHCVLNYPTENKDAHLGMIKGLRSTFPHNLIGYSDHTVPDNTMHALTLAYQLGACVIEKHFTDDKTQAGNDHYHAMDLEDLKRLKKALLLNRELVGSEEIKKATKKEEISRLNARRSIVVVKDLEKGHELQECDVTCKRPGIGISPIYWDDVVGMKLKIDIKADTLLAWENLIAYPI